MAGIFVGNRLLKNIKGDRLNLDLLARQPLYSMQATQTGANIEQYVKSVGIRFSITKSVPNFESLMYAVAHNDGFALVGKIRTSGYDNIRLFPVNEGEYTHDLCMAWRSDNESEHLQRFIRYISQIQNLEA